MRQFLILILLAPAMASAEQGPVLPELELTKVIMTLGFVLCVIYGIAFFIKKQTGFQTVLNGQIKTLAMQPLGTKEKIILIEVSGEQLLVGVTSQSIQLIKALDNPIVMEESKPTQSFSQTLKQILSKEKSHD